MCQTDRTITAGPLLPSAKPAHGELILPAPSSMFYEGDKLLSAPLDLFSPLPASGTRSSNRRDLEFRWHCLVTGNRISGTERGRIPKRFCHRVLESFDINPHMANKPEIRLPRSCRHEQFHNSILPPLSLFFSRWVYWRQDFATAFSKGGLQQHLPFKIWNSGFMIVRPLCSAHCL